MQTGQWIAAKSLAQEVATRRRRAGVAATKQALQHEPWHFRHEHWLLTVHDWHSAPIFRSQVSHSCTPAGRNRGNGRYSSSISIPQKRSFKTRMFFRNLSTSFQFTSCSMLSVNSLFWRRSALSASDIFKSAMLNGSEQPLLSSGHPRSASRVRERFPQSVDDVRVSC